MRRFDDRLGQIKLVHGFEIAADCLGDERPRPVDPGRHRGGPPARNVAAEAGRDLDPRRDVAAGEPLLEIGIIGKRRRFDEIGRAAQFLEIGAAFVAAVAVEDGEGEGVDVSGDAKTENQHQKGRAEQGKPEPDRITHQLQRLPDRTRHKASQTECRALAGQLGSRGLLSCKGNLGRLNDATRSGRLLEIADECILERSSAARLDKARWRVGRQHAAGVHQ